MITVLSNINPKGDNSATIQAAIDSAVTGDTIQFPSGYVPIYQTIQLNKRLKLIGDETIVRPYFNVPALIVSGYNDIKPAIIDGIDFFNAYNKDDKSNDGVVCMCITHLRNSWIKAFGGHGVNVHGDISHSKTNASFSRFDNLTISENKGSGMYFQGGDSNQSNCYHIDIRDNLGYGIWDHSFLGNQFFGCMAHNNHLGNYRADDANNRTGFFGCYSEGGSPPDYLNGSATWHGGLAANTIALHGYSKVYMKDTVYKT